MEELLKWCREVTEETVFISDGPYEEGYGWPGYEVPKIQHVLEGLDLEDAFGLKWEMLRSEHVSDNTDEDGDIVSTTSHLWQTLPRWGAFRDFDRTSLTLKGMDKTIRSAWSVENVHKQFNSSSPIFDKLFRSEATESAVATMYDINRQTFQ